LNPRALGLAKPPLVIDGMMGHETEIAVRAFQASALLTIDGDPGPLTVAALTKPSPPARVASTG
jgi:peptidoglycan hydrolase-like protein with peptidoglycan-binding domain